MEPENIIKQIIIYAVPILVAIILHEVSHGFVAFKLGDPTAKMMGRLTLNPIAHIDLFGTIIMPLLLLVSTGGQFVFGYAKPVPINPYNFRNPRRDMAISAAGGPVMNFLVASLSIILLKHIVIPFADHASAEMIGKVLKPTALMLGASIQINIVLAVFNLIPIPPLDGGRVLMGFLPDRQAYLLGRIEPFGMIIVLVLVATGFAGYIISPLIRLLMGLAGMGL
ncbi:MAG: site-2 protease family protein [Nitrospirae bacterium]|nr:site-2 protease family protein [Nitrospirota bacterium]